MDEEVEVVDRNDLIFRIRIANALSLFDDARENIQILIENYGKELTKEERNLFAVFYKSLVNKFRREYDMYMDLQREIPRKEILKQRILRDNMYRARYEVVTICKEVIDLIDHGIVDTKNIELKIYFMKLRADYYRYWSGVVSEDQFFGVRKRAEDCYQIALELADKKLKRYHPLRLALMLNMSIHYYAIPCERIKALQLSMQAVTEGKEHIRDDPDIHVVVNLLRDNLDAWMAGLGPDEVQELEFLEGVRKWHGKRAAVASAHLRRYLSGEPSPKFDPPMPVRQRYFTMPQPLVQYSELDQIYVCNYVPLKRDASVLYEPLFEPLTISTSHKQQIPLTEPESAATKSENTGTELQSTQMESQIIAPITTTSSTLLATTTELQPTTIDQDPNSTEAPENINLCTFHIKPASPTISFGHALCEEQTEHEEDASHEKHASHEEHVSYEEHVSNEEHVSHEEHVSLPDPFEGIFQPVLSSLSMLSSSTTSSQSHDEDDNDNLEQGENRPSILRTSSAPRDIPRTNQIIPSTVDPTSGLTKRLHSFESRMLSIKRSQLRLAAERESEGGHPDEVNDSLPEVRGTTSVVANAEPQIASNIMATATIDIPQHIVTSEVPVLSQSQITSELGTVGELQPQSQNIPIDRAGDDRDTELQQQLTAFSNQPAVNVSASLREIDLSTQHQQHQNISKTEPTKPSRTYEHLVFPEPAPPTPPPQVIFTPLGPKIIGNFSPTPSLEGAVAAVSPSSSAKKKSKVVTFSEKHTYWSSQSIEGETWSGQLPTQRTTRQRSTRQRSTRPPSLSPPSFEREQQPENRSSQEITVTLPQDPSPHQVSLYPQQLHRQDQSLESRRRKLAQQKLLRRSFSAPREGAIWPISSLTREPVYFIYKVLRRASVANEQIFGRRFLSAHSSAEDLYDEAAEKVFPDPWAPRGARTMRNTFPITPWYPNEEPRVPWIR
ncbi:hypothetical protein LOAG_07044 [Loa loa]|uniref:14-3-3 domain-containing protein n=2 Tax=Loa loa TaxID=7209 RepID=A0A1S0TWK7_LOALO|nr:hypothetical protein LOAG_07044 [Loa loa]EFO21442.1 hypothetical protein LOAG_07044 [Loa loa]